MVPADEAQGQEPVLLLHMRQLGAGEGTGGVMQAEEREVWRKAGRLRMTMTMWCGGEVRHNVLFDGFALGFKHIWVPACDVNVIVMLRRLRVCGRFQYSQAQQVQTQERRYVCSSVCYWAKNLVPPHRQSTREELVG